MLKRTEKLAGVHPDLVAVIELAATRIPFDIVVSEGLRNKKRQAELVRKGASQTMNSRHFTGHAVDILPVEDSGAWPLYHKMAPIIKSCAKELRIPIEWGGDWKSLKDGPHWQLPWKQYPAVVYSAMVNDMVSVEPPTPEEEPDRDLKASQSKTIQGATLTGGVTLLGAVAEGAKSVTDIKDSSSWLLQYLPLIFSALALIGVGYIIYQRLKSMKLGDK